MMWQHGLIVYSGILPVNCKLMTSKMLAWNDGLASWLLSNGIIDIDVFIGESCLKTTILFFNKG